MLSIASIRTLVSRPPLASSMRSCVDFISPLLSQPLDTLSRLLQVESPVVLQVVWLVRIHDIWRVTFATEDDDAWVHSPHGMETDQSVAFQII